MIIKNDNVDIKTDGFSDIDLLFTEIQTSTKKKYFLFPFILKKTGKDTYEKIPLSKVPDEIKQTVELIIEKS